MEILKKALTIAPTLVTINYESEANEIITTFDVNGSG
jgi:hypothetical protein